MAEATMKRKKFKPYPLEPLTEEDLESSDGISKAINRWLKEYTKPGPNGISEADKAYLANLYTPQGRLVTKLLEQLNKEEKDGE